MIHSLDRKDSKKWTQLGAKTEDPWWTLKENYEYAKSFVSKVITKQQSAFIEGSFNYSAYQGARFNPPKSCRSLYLSEDPETSLLEVSYHVFSKNFKTLKSFNQAQQNSKLTFKRSLPEVLDFYLVVFHVECNLAKANIADMSNRENLYNCLVELGYDRYIDKNKRHKDSINFSMSNDYSICQQLAACSLAKGIKGIRYESARLSERRNLVVFKDGHITIGPEFAIVNVQCKPSFEDRRHEFKIYQGEKQISRYLLDPIHKRSLRVVHRFQPIDGVKDDKRETIQQKFHAA
ncbi:RES family NAD+ phosphorylase [Oligoflexus tunisiensis]|uniref:RES family NAD+ phosphorylase n=1 Tax=Oligoflexus tunisiensis TaxID=708132 RepID=UPI001C4043A3|nr:RES family NAD+ phosphorylase [Oligoflexus tunisiensis]